MLLKFKNIKTTFAIGLRWAVDTRKGIEVIADVIDMNYGFVLDIPNASNKKLKSSALAKQDHAKSVSLAGAFSRLYRNLILVHRLNDYFYWLCIIREGEVWSGIDVPKATAGDFVGDLEKVNAVLEFAKEEFSSAGIDVADIAYCTDTAADSFQDFKNFNFMQNIMTANKYRRPFTIKYLEPTEMIVRKLVMLVIVLGIVGGAFYYVYHRHLMAELLNQQEIQRQRMIEQQKLAEVSYFKGLQNNVKERWGYKVIGELMQKFKMLSLQSKGWSLSKASFNAAKPNELKLDLTRSDYGTVDTFLYAYTPKGEQGTLSNDNNAGSKVVTFPELKGVSVYGSPVVSQQELTQKIFRNMYKLISYMQTTGQDFSFNVDSKSVSQYGVHVAKFTISADSLWKLQELQSALRMYNLLTVDSVVFTVKNYEMSWQLKGEIYA